MKNTEKTIFKIIARVNVAPLITPSSFALPTALGVSHTVRRSRGDDRAIRGFHS